MPFREHHSLELRTLFQAKPYQGADPAKAAIVFLSSDANYAPEISEPPFFNYILEYHKDGAAFWMKYGKHHPFLLDQYPFKKTQGGRRFHKTFSKIGLDSRYAEQVSFIELLDIPTIGNKSKDRKLFDSYANLEHLKWIDQLYLKPANRLIFVSRGVLRDMVRLRRNTELFQWLPKSLPRDKFETSANGNKVQEIYHFSSSHIHRQINLIKNMIDAWLAKSVHEWEKDYTGTAIDAARCSQKAVARRLTSHSAKEVVQDMNVKLGSEEIDPRTVRPDPSNANWTTPRTYGVYAVTRDGAADIRFGNHPVRQRELEREFGAATLIALYNDRELAKARAKAERKTHHA
ncbi:hypothetical protein [Allohahella marinimesophila]|uniref:Uncharacterized protein n=1 Tax=Allohahella marinimesophila TaxID=1054972 RepID=A0ABP7NRE7_9GAMM